MSTGVWHQMSEEYKHKYSKATKQDILDAILAYSKGTVRANWNTPMDWTPAPAEEQDPKTFDYDKFFKDLQQ